MGSSGYKEKVEALSTIKIRGKLFEETDDSVTLHVGNSLFEIPRESILSITDVEGVEAKTVDVSIDRNAKIIHKTLVTPDTIIGAITSRARGKTSSGISPRWDCADCHWDCGPSWCHCA